MKIQSKRAIKSGASNFGSNDDVFGYSFPLVTYIAENYYYDEETDSETEERDYDADNWEYEDAIKAAEDLADEMNIPMYKDYSEPYLCGEPFMVEIEYGYYEGIYIKIREGTDEEDVYDTNEYGSYYNGGREFTEEEMNEFSDKMDAYLDKLCEDYGWQKLGVSARFSNGETWYSKISSAKNRYGWDPDDGMPVIEWANSKWFAFIPDRKYFENECKKRGITTIKNIDEFVDLVKDMGGVYGDGEGHFYTFPETGMIKNSHKPIKSGMSYQQVLDEFTAGGKPWDDYWSMQYDWTAFVDGLERDDLVDYNEARWWDNPCTPETFREWKNS